jgi:hypothetical protein
MAGGHELSSELAAVSLLRQMGRTVDSFANDTGGNICAAFGTGAFGTSTSPSDSTNRQFWCIETNRDNAPRLSFFDGHDLQAL